MRVRRAEGKVGAQTMSLNVRCGSALIRQIVEVLEVFRGCGTASLEGLSLFLSVRWVLVVRVSQMGVESS